jgi:hypothetical protein
MIQAPDLESVSQRDVLHGGSEMLASSVGVYRGHAADGAGALPLMPSVRRTRISHAH